VSYSFTECSILAYSFRCCAALKSTWVSRFVQSLMFFISFSRCLSSFDLSLHNELQKLILGIAFASLFAVAVFLIPLNYLSIGFMIWPRNFEGFKSIHDVSFYSSLIFVNATMPTVWVPVAAYLRIRVEILSYAASEISEFGDMMDIAIVHLDYSDIQCVQNKEGHYEVLGNG